MNSRFKLIKKHVPSRVSGAAVVEEDGAGVDGRADGAEGDVPAHLPAHLVHRVDVERHRVLCANREFITLISVLKVSLINTYTALFIHSFAIL